MAGSHDSRTGALMPLASHEDCNGWDYETHPNASSVTEACKIFLVELRNDPASKAAALADTRPFHALMFSAVVPAACPYLAGNYRGSDFECLRAYNVRFGHHHGTFARGVIYAMEEFHEDLRGALEDLDKAGVAPEAPLTGRFFLIRLIQILAATLVRFFTIHPYANGNGHMGRLLIWSALGRYNRLPVRWWLDGSPPEYGPLIDAHRAGHAMPLEKFLMRCIVGTK